MITQAELKARFTYDPDTGLFERRSKVTGLYSPAGAVKRGGKNAGYVTFRVDRRDYFAHRLAWLYVYGSFPTRNLDHINRVKHDNRISNLREATLAQNQMNTGLTSRNVSGFKGVSYREKQGKYAACISVLSRDLYLGSFQTPEEASAQYERFAREIHREFYYQATPNGT